MVKHISKNKSIQRISNIKSKILPIHKDKRKTIKSKNKVRASNFKQKIKKQVQKFQEISSPLEPQNDISEHLKMFWSALIQDESEDKIHQSLKNLQSQCPKMLVMQDLLNTSIDKIFAVDFLWPELQHYIQCVKLSKINGKKKYILRSYEAACLLKTKEQQFKSFQCYKMSMLEALLLQKRDSFMEEVALSQRKYSQENGQLNQVTKEMLFLCKCFQKIRLQIIEGLNKIQDEVSFQKDFQKLRLENILKVQNQYSQKLLEKNIKYGFRKTPHSFDVLNYFKNQDHIEERGQIGQFVRITDIKEFKKYVHTREKKHNNRCYLRTACSVCFSNYFELFNPLVMCRVCSLRAHKHCFNLKEETCGNCLYKKLPLIAKEAIPHCKLCPFNNIMTIKVEEKLFIHPFCLLFYSSSAEYEKKQSQNENYKEKSSYFKQLYTKLNLKKNQVYHTKINTFQIKNENQFSFDKFKIKSLEQKYAMQIQSVFDINLKNMNEPTSIMDDIQNEMYNEKQIECSMINQFCNACKFFFNNSLKIHCRICQKSYHACCAYFQGFQIEWKQHGIEINCCVDDKKKQGWIRKFCLNQQQYVREVWKSQSQIFSLTFEKNNSSNANILD